MSVNVSVAVPRCCLHVDSYELTDCVILFTPATIQKCRDKRDARLRLRKKSKFNDVVLPDQIDETTGYHSACYKSFCSLGMPKIDSSSSIETNFSTDSETSNYATDEEATQSTSSLSDS